ncbi:hypothetical protein [Paracoccus pacificus]|uniref:Uncharacterized protein n=1 Tax=Paracoccus pacificus TaxID=1463598 RepID=A0ABW4R6P6_9RHOB
MSTDFDDWLTRTHAEAGDFTVLVVLVGIAEDRVDLLRSTHMHVMGTEIEWAQLAQMLDGSGVAWSGVVLFRAGREGLVPDDEARNRLQSLMRAMTADRGLIRDGAFFNRDGLSLRLDDAEPQPPRLT